MAKPKPSKAARVAIAKIRVDGGTQSREQLNADTVAEYQAAYASSSATTMPPVVVFYDGKTHWLADGFHRAAAAQAAGQTTIAVDVKQGTQRDAVLYSVGANTTHGLRRSNADKRKAVLLLLGDAEWSKKSDRWIAEACAVDHMFVGKLRRTGGDVSTCPPTKRLGRDGKVQSATKTKPAPKKRGTVTPIGSSSRQIELPATAHVEPPQPERTPLVVAARASDLEPDDDDDPAPKGVILALVHRYILRVADEWNPEWDFRDLVGRIRTSARYVESRHEEERKNKGNG